MVARDMQDEQNRPRLRWLDIAKGLGIILVVLGHAERGLLHSSLQPCLVSPAVLDDWIYAFHMPLFFLVSGIALRLARQTSLWGLLKQRSSVILYPYLAWSVLQGAVEVAAAPYTNGHATVREVLSLVWAPRAQFWFLYVLFFCTVFCGFLRNARGAALLLALGGACVMGVLAPSLSGIWVLDKIAFNFAFMFIGFVLPTSVVGWRMSPSTATWSLMLGSILMVSILASVVLSQAYELPIARFALAWVGVAGMLLISHALDARAPRLADRLAFVGTKSLEIFLLHVTLVAAARLFGFWLGVGVSFEFAMALLTLVGVLGSLALERLIRGFGWNWLFRYPTAAMTGGAR